MTRDRVLTRPSEENRPQPTPPRASGVRYGAEVLWVELQDGLPYDKVKVLEAGSVAELNEMLMAAKVGARVSRYRLDLATGKKESIDGQGRRPSQAEGLRRVSELRATLRAGLAGVDDGEPF